MAHVKKQLLEYLIRQCVKEVLEQVSEDETVGAASPPADGLGTAEQPALPKKPTSVSETKLKKEWINVKEGKSLSPEINELKQAIKRIVREVFSE